MSQYVRQYGLIENRSNPERYVRKVHWEQHWELLDGDYERLVLQPVARVWESLTSDRYGMGGHARKWVLTRVTELSARQRPRGQSEPSVESETLRRERIRAIRRAIHVDPSKGSAEPEWRKESASAAA